MARRRTASFLVAIVLLLVATVTLAGGLPLRLVKGDATAVVELDRKVLTEGTAYYKNSKGVVSGPLKIKGVRLIYLVCSIGGMEATDKLLVVSSDGYVTELDYAKHAAIWRDEAGRLSSGGQARTRAVSHVVGSWNGERTSRGWASCPPSRAA